MSRLVELVGHGGAVRVDDVEGAVSMQTSSTAVGGSVVRSIDRTVTFVTTASPTCV